VQSAYRDTQTLAKHALGLYDIRTFEETKATLQGHLDGLIVYVVLESDWASPRLPTAACLASTGC